MEKLVYIASTGYSGSTLLESLLGTNAGWFNLGEPYKIGWWPKCGCGEVFEDCPFWNAVKRDLENVCSGEVNLREFHVSGKRKSGRLPNLHDLFVAKGSLGTAWLYSLSGDVRRFRTGCRKALELYTSVSKVAQAPILIDSSKDPALLKHLFCLAPKKFRVIHLVRDARAVAWSHSNNFDRDGATYPSKGEERRPSYSETAQYWRKRNRNITMALDAVPESKKLFLRYEDFCEDPAETAAKISLLVESDISLPPSFKPRAQHSISGNPMRFTEKEIVLNFKEDWRRRLTAEDVAEVEGVAGELNSSYGYQ